MLAFACQNAASARQVGQAARASTRRGGSLPRQPDDHVAVALPGPRVALRRARTAALCPDPPGFSFAIVGAMLTQLIVGSREVRGGDS